MIRVGIMGATGYVGSELVRILLQHPKVELKLLSSRIFFKKKKGFKYQLLEIAIGLFNLTYGV